MEVGWTFDTGKLLMYVLEHSCFKLNQYFYIVLRPCP
jgi:hypothetical protein